MILRQREKVAEQAASADPSKPRPPEARVREMSNSGALGMAFTAKLDVPEEETRRLQDQNLRNRRLLAAGEKPEKSLISVYAVKQEDADDDSSQEPIMDGWDLISFGPEGIEFSLNFTNPIEVSGGEDPDLLLV